jgi:hypothetical protein
MCATCEERGLGELYVAGDQACEHGELASLVHIAEHLSEHVPEPLHCELVALARRCSDPSVATDAWDQLKKRLRDVAVRS